MARQFFDDPKWKRRLMISPFIVIPILIVVAGVSYQWFSNQQAAQTLVFKIFVVLFAVVAWASLLIRIWMKRTLMAPLSEGMRVAQNSVHIDLVRAAQMKTEVRELVRRVNTIRLRMGDTVGRCAETSQRVSEPPSKQAA